MTSDNKKALILKCYEKRRENAHPSQRRLGIHQKILPRRQDKIFHYKLFRNGQPACKAELKELK